MSPSVSAGAAPMPNAATPFAAEGPPLMHKAAAPFGAEVALSASPPKPSSPAAQGMPTVSKAIFPSPTLPTADTNSSPPLPLGNDWLRVFANKTESSDYSDVNEGFGRPIFRSTHLEGSGLFGVGWAGTHSYRSR